MSWKIGWALCLLLCAGSVLAQAASAPPDSASRIAARVAQQGTVRAQFTQTKHLAAMKRPLVTQGRLLFVPSQGAVWRIEQPLQMTYVLKEDRIVEIDAEGRVNTRNANAPGLKQVSQILRAVMGAQIDLLRDTFTVQAEENAQGWTLKLTPRDARLAQFIKELSVQGSDSIDSLKIQEAQGDSTHLQFRGTERSVTPTAEETRWLEAK